MAFKNLTVPLILLVAFWGIGVAFWLLNTPYGVLDLNLMAEEVFDSLMRSFCR